MFDNIFIYFKENLSFNGLKLRKTNSYPWKNRREKITYYDDLLGRKDRESYKELSKKETIEEIHIYLSKSFMSEYLSYFLSLVSLLLIYKFHLVEVGVTTLIISLMCILGKFIYRNKADKNYNTLDMVDIMIDFVFDMK